MKSIQALREKRAALTAQTRTLLKESPEFTAAEEKQYENNMEEIRQIDTDMKKIVDFQAKMVEESDLESGLVNPANCKEVWRDNKGNPVAILGPKNSFAGPVSGSGSYSGSDGMNNISAGAIMRALAIGPKNSAEVLALSEGTDSAGGYTVPDIVSRQLIDLARSKSHAINAGALTVPLTTEKTTIVRIASDPIPAWRMENTSITEDEPTFEPVTFQARSLAVLVKASRELLDDSVNIEQALMMALAGAMGGEIDRVSLLGSGIAPEPSGIVNTPGVNVVDLGTDGAALTRYADMLTAYQMMSDGNANDPTAAIMAPRERFAYAGMVDSQGQPLNRPDIIRDLPFLGTTKLPVDLTHGTATNASRMFLGDFSQLMFGIRSGLRIEMLKERFVDSLQIGFLCHLRMDVALAQPKAFTVIEGIIPEA